MKKLLSIILCLTMVFAMSSTAFASYDIAKLDGHLINEDGTISSTTVDDIDKIIHERNKAVIDGAIKEASSLEAELYKLGAHKSTAQELKTFADSSDSSNLERVLTSSVTYTTIHYYAVANGTLYEIQRTSALPTTSSNLFHSASVNNKTTSSSVASGSYELCKVLGTLAAGSASPVAGACISAFDALKSVITGFASSTVVYGITASYVCAALEQVSFYEYKTASGYWEWFATSSYVQTGFSSTIFSTSYSGGSSQGLNMEVDSMEDTIYSTYSYNSITNSYDTGDMLERYFTTYIFDKYSQVMGVIFYHDADGESKSIKMLGMLCPTNESEIT